MPRLLLGKLVQGSILVEILEIPLFLGNHCRLSEQIACLFVEFVTFNQDVSSRQFYYDRAVRDVAIVETFRKSNG